MLNRSSISYKLKNRRIGAASEMANEKNDQLAWLRNLVVIAAVLSAAGCLFGYGVAMGFSSSFGLGTGVWYSSTLELISLSGEGILGLYSVVRARSEALDSLLRLMLLCAAATGCLTLLLILVFRAKSSSWQRLSRWWRKAISVFRSEKTASPSAPSFPSGREMSVVSVAVAAGFLGVPAVALAFFALLVSLSTLPVIGVQSGMAYAKAAILQADSCVSPPQARMRFEREQAMASEPKKMNLGAQCVEVVDATTRQAVSGKLIVSRPGYVIIYRPAQDDTLLVMVKDAGLRTTAQLPAAAATTPRNP